MCDSSHTSCRRASQNRYRADFGGIAGILMVPVPGRHKLVSEPQVDGTPTSPACRIALPTVVEFRVSKPIFENLLDRSD